MEIFIYAAFNIIGESLLQWLFLGNFICGFTPFLHHGGIEHYESV